MRRLLTAVAGAVAIILAAIGAVHAQQKSTLDQVLERGTLRVGTTGDFKPMSFRDPATNDYVGFDIDVAKALAADMGVEIEFVATDWKTLVNGIVADKYDITTSASVSMDRAKVAGYSSPYFYVGTLPLTLSKNADRFKGWADINAEDVTIAASMGTVFEAQARSLFNKASIKTVEAPARDFQEVLAGRADASITSNVEAAALVETYPQLMIVPGEMRHRRPLAFLLPRADQIWMNYVNHWIALRSAGGLFEELEAKWFGR